MLEAFILHGWLCFLFGLRLFFEHQALWREFREAIRAIDARYAVQFAELAQLRADYAQIYGERI